MIRGQEILLDNLDSMDIKVEQIPFKVLLIFLNKPDFHKDLVNLSKNDIIKI
jgi:hypothetical protein